MHVLKSSKIVCFDVDDTLVLWNDDYSFANHAEGIVEIQDPFFPAEMPEDRVYLYLKPNKEVIELLKDYKTKGYTVVVWSAGGWQWARQVVETLKLIDQVDLCMSKPDAYVDDNDSMCWMGTYIAIGLGGKIVHPSLIKA